MILFNLEKFDEIIGPSLRKSAIKVTTRRQLVIFQTPIHELESRGSATSLDKAVAMMSFLAHLR